MRLLLDECVPRPLRRYLAAHTVATVQEIGWAGIKNGALLARTRESAFEVFVTVDQNLAYQQNLRAAGVAVIVLVAASNRLQDLEPLVPALLECLKSVRPGELVRLGG